MRFFGRCALRAADLRPAGMAAEERGVSVLGDPSGCRDASAIARATTTGSSTIET